MTEKIFVCENDVVTLVCPECNKSSTADISKYKKLEKQVKLNVVCTCGKAYSVILERRQYYRKKVDLSGKYIYHPPVGPLVQGLMTVIDISRKGLKMRFRQPPAIKIGAILEVTFHLDDKNASQIKKEAEVKKISKDQIHAEFRTLDASDPSDKALGFYLF